ncbi:hypothetical protein [Treponema pectinovorum]|uniref:hypothetical protein n=1 Tax=Treponema pectinovorum TaxID=164 RepID=UPI00164DF4BB|nr:hypothetical protein [Treponema pectinovorum]
MLRFTRSKERDEDLAPAARQGGVDVTDKKSRPLEGQILDKTYLQMCRTLIKCPS